MNQSVVELTNEFFSSTVVVDTPVDTSRAVIPINFGVPQPINLNPEINATIERRFNNRVRDAVHDEAVAQVNERMVAIDQMLR